MRPTRSQSRPNLLHVALFNSRFATRATLSRPQSKMYRYWRGFLLVQRLIATTGLPSRMLAIPLLGCKVSIAGLLECEESRDAATHICPPPSLAPTESAQEIHSDCYMFSNGQRITCFHQTYLFIFCKFGGTAWRRCPKQASKGDGRPKAAASFRGVFMGPKVQSDCKITIYSGLFRAFLDPCMGPKVQSDCRLTTYSGLAGAPKFNAIVNFQYILGWPEPQSSIRCKFTIYSGLHVRILHRSFHGTNNSIRK